MIDINLKGAFYGIVAALPVFRQQCFGHFIHIFSTAGLVIKPTMAVYAGTKKALRAITEGLQQEAGDKLRVTGISPGFVQINFADSMTNPAVKAQVVEKMGKMRFRRPLLEPLPSPLSSQPRWSRQRGVPLHQLAGDLS